MLSHKAFVWAKGAQTFSHQERLKADVMRMMAELPAAARLAEALPTPPRPELPEASADTTVKKLLFSARSLPGLAVPGDRVLSSVCRVEERMPAAPAEEAPYQPPRSAQA